MTTYETFLASKVVSDPSTGIKDVPELGSYLFDFQHDIVSWALRRGRAAIFADCGMGKTIMQLEWARHVATLHGPVLILAPLAVAAQTVREGKRFGIDVYYERKHPENVRGITITNYEMLEHFDVSAFSGIVLDESSILKSFEGVTRNQIIEAFHQTPFRLACTATPAPNDYMELGNHAEFIGAMTRTEMLAMFFVHDGGETQKWRLKGHAESDYWRWLCSWAVTIRKPSDLGYSDDKFTLPAITLHEIVVQAENTGDNLFNLPAATLQERISARRNSIGERVSACATLVKGSDEPWIIWCNLNGESDAITRAIHGAVEVKGADTRQEKENALAGFSSGDIRVLVTKPSIAGFGMNWQHCRNVAFVGLSDSYEQFYQAIRRCWRFGQTKEVRCHLIIGDAEGAVLANIKRKEKEAERMAENMVKHMADLTKAEMKGITRSASVYKAEKSEGKGWTAYLGDCVEGVGSLPADSIHYSIFSPPFASLYTYSNSERDMGNCKDAEAFLTHFRYLVRELYRVTMPGRLVSFHCMNLPTSKTHHGYIGIQDFRGDLIRVFQAAGFIYHSEVVIWKDPVTAMQRTKALGLLHKQIKKDSTMSRQGIPDYLVTMRKSGENPEPVNHTNETFPVQLWQRYASPIWMDINPSKTLQYRSAREHNDERHICPLQLEVIERAVELWTNPGDLILSPFMGIASEGVTALEKGRRFVGFELKESYWKQAAANLAIAEKRGTDGLLFEEPCEVAG